MPSARTLRRDLVTTLERRGCIRSKAVRKAFSTVPRELFVPEIAQREGLERVYADTALVTRQSTQGMALSSSSQPAIMAEMLECLDLRPGLRVLEMGTGTGHNAALLWKLVAPSGTVTSVELEEDLAAAADAALRAGGYPVSVLGGDAHSVVDGQRGTYDRIVVTASSGHVPHGWRDALVDGGLLELPLRLPGSAQGEQIVVTLRREGEALRSVAIVPGGFMHLRHPGQDGPVPRPVAALSVTEFVEGKARSLASVSGPGLVTLRPAARRRLAAVMLTKPCVRRLATPAPANTSLIAFLGMTEAPDGVTVRTVRPEPDARYRAGAGVASRDGSGLALAVGLAERPGCRIEVYGEGPGARSAARSVDRLVRQWRKAGRPSLADCEISVTYGEAPTGTGLQVSNHGDCFVALRWPC